MSKKLLVVISNDNVDMIKFALTFTFNVKQSGKFEDVKLFFFGPSEKVLSENEEVKKLFLKISKDGNFTSVACINVANFYGIKEKLESLNITLNPIGADITKAVNEDYVPMTF